MPQKEKCVFLTTIHHKLWEQKWLFNFTTREAKLYIKRQNPKRDHLIAIWKAFTFQVKSTHKSHQALIKHNSMCFVTGSYTCICYMSTPQRDEEGSYKRSVAGRTECRIMNAITADFIHNLSDWCKKIYIYKYTYIYIKGLSNMSENSICCIKVRSILRMKNGCTDMIKLIDNLEIQEDTFI